MKFTESLMNQLKKGLMYELCNRYEAEVGLFDTVVEILRNNDMLPVDDETPIYEDR